MRVLIQRIYQEYNGGHQMFDNSRPNLSIAALRARQDGLYLQPDFFVEEFGGGGSGDELI